jgi:hypothetical protein
METMVKNFNIHFGKNIAKRQTQEKLLKKQRFRLQET